MKRSIPISEYTYPLPESRIAKYPLKRRDQSKLLIYSQGNIREDRFCSLPGYITENSILFFNNTKVIHARLLFRKSTGANIEIFCLQPVEPADYQLAFAEKQRCVWRCMIGNLRKWKDEVLSQDLDLRHKRVILNARKIRHAGQEVHVEFFWNTGCSFAELIYEAGKMPIPPYLNRPSEEIDKIRYQTVYSRFEGSVAAPTAGLHFTTEMMEKLDAVNIPIREITLHVGAGTFQPVKHADALKHAMHPEYFSVPASTVKILADHGRKVIATGTTTLRTLESLYWLALKSVSSGKIDSKLSQWEYMRLPQNVPADNMFRDFHRMLEQNHMSFFQAQTEIMVTPGYPFKVVDGLITNFHQPQSTLILLVASFIGHDWKKVYDFAMSKDFRFLSYGDSSLLWRSSG